MMGKFCIWGAGGVIQFWGDDSLGDGKGHKDGE